MPLEKWAEAIAARLQEQADMFSQSDIQKGLADCLNDEFPGKYACICDIYGDGDSGDVVYYVDGDTYRAPYSMGMVGGKRTHSIDTAQAVDVLPRTIYDEEADEQDSMAGMSEAERVERFPGSAAWTHSRLSERFISKSERDAADGGDFAGGGKSFPILKPSDVMAAVHSIGRGVAGGQSAQKIKNGIIRIAKKKGWTKYLPKAWQDGGDTAQEAADIDLQGDVIPLREGAVGQDGTAYLKLIAPGWGSSGYYSKEVLKRDGPKSFKAGTKNFWNHQTAAEEAARPEGDLRDLASTLTEDARWEDNGPAGPGLYAKANVQPHFREHVDSLAKHIGMSIRASGRAKEGKAEGKSGPIIEQLTRGISVDYVTTPGAGGKILQLFEAARGRQSQSQGEITDMDEATVTRLIERATAPLLAKLAEYENKPKRSVAIRALLEGINLPTVAKERIVEHAEAHYPLTEAGATDEARLKTIVEAKVKEEAAYISSLTGRVVNLGASAGVSNDPKIQEAAAEQWDKQFRESQVDLADIFLDNNSETDEALAKRRRDIFTRGRAA